MYLRFALHCAVIASFVPLAFGPMKAHAQPALPVELPTLAQLANDIQRLRRDLEDARKERSRLQQQLLEFRAQRLSDTDTSANLLNRRDPRIIIVPQAPQEGAEQQESAPEIFRGQSGQGNILPSPDLFPAPLPPRAPVEEPAPVEPSPEQEPEQVEQQEPAVETRSEPKAPVSPDTQAPPIASSQLTARLQDKRVEDDFIQTANASDSYTLALELLRESKYDQATSALTTFLDRFSSARQAPSARYWIAEVDFVRMNYEQSIRKFINNLDTDGLDGPKGKENLLKLGMSYAALGRNREACEVFERFGELTEPLRGYLANTLERESRRSDC